MPKLKTKSGAKKRFALTGTGKIKRKNAFKSSAFYHFALNAKGGDKFDFLED